MIFPPPSFRAHISSCRAVRRGTWTFCQPLCRTWQKDRSSRSYTSPTAAQSRRIVAAVSREAGRKPQQKQLRAVRRLHCWHPIQVGKSSWMRNCIWAISAIISEGYCLATFGASTILYHLRLLGGFISRLKCELSAPQDRSNKVDSRPVWIERSLTRIVHSNSCIGKVKCLDWPLGLFVT